MYETKYLNCIVPKPFYNNNNSNKKPENLKIQGYIKKDHRQELDIIIF